MSANQFGDRLSVTTFGESHGEALGVVIEGLPGGMKFDGEILKNFLKRRRPGQSHIVSGRQEQDEPEILSGIFQGQTLGGPIAVLVRNKDQRSEDYEPLKDQPRRGHADETWKIKFGIHDHRGGGRSSGRETVSRVIAGAFAKMFLGQIDPQLEILSFSSQIADIALFDEERQSFLDQPHCGEVLQKFDSRMPNENKDRKIKEKLLEAKSLGKSYGGVAEVLIRHPQPGLGQPVFHKLKSDLCAAFMSLGATSGVEIGAGFSAARAEGSEFHSDSDMSVYGGQRGGISTGEDMSLKVAFKPTSSVLNVAKKGRHDPCIVPRAVCVLEAMAYIVMADHYLWSRTDRMECLNG